MICKSCNDSDHDGTSVFSQCFFFLRNRSAPQCSWVGYILEVDLEYPYELHELHNDYPLAPEKREISHNALSDCCGNIAVRLN